MASPAPAKSQPLHNFDLPRTLKWNGKSSSHHPQRRRSVKSPSRRPHPSPIRHESPPLRESSSPPMEAGGVIEYRRTQGGGEEMSRSSKKLLIKIKNSKSEAEPEDDDDNNNNPDYPKSNSNNPDMKLEVGEEEGSQNLEEGDQENEEAKTWNLRPRRPIRRSLNVNGVGRTNVVDKGKGVQSPVIGRGGEGEAFERRKLSGGLGLVEREKRKLSVQVSLTKEEIEEDIFAFTGAKPARRPRKRNRTAQKHVDFAFPGLWLVGITPESYRVSESSLKV